MANATTSQSTPTQGWAALKRGSWARTICIAILIFLVLVGLVALITWSALRPKKLVFSIDEAAIHEYNLTNSELNSTFDLTIRAQNPNHKISVYYDMFLVYVQYRGQVVATRAMEPFFQAKKNETLLRTESVARNLGLNGSNEQVLKSERTNGSVDLDVRVRGKIRFRVGKWKSGHYKLKVLCSPVVVFSDPKKFEAATCEVNI